MSKLKLSLFASIVFTAGLSLVSARAERHGPFPVSLNPIQNMAFTYNRKLEAPTQALALATNAPAGYTLVDGILTLQDGITIDTPVIDPATQKPQIDANGDPVVTSVDYPAGTKLNPKVNPDDDLLLPDDITVSTLAIADGKFPVGRFGYLGVAPRFDSANLEMFASKMGHSLRVKAWVTPDILDTYEYTLLSRFKSYSDMLGKNTIHLEPLRDLKKMAADAPTADLKKWYTVAAYYGKHLYENSTLDIYRAHAPEADYKQMILTLMIQTYLADPSATVESGLALYEQYQRDPAFLLTRREHSAALFRAQFKGMFQEGPAALPLSPIVPIDPPASVDPAVSHANALGYLTFVYPIAIDKEGPFKLPDPGLRKFPLRSSLEGRWFSNRWLSEFGGFPFLQITEDGVAFHGPITMSTDGDTWFLHRDNVSHSCMRMDASDLLELRALIPRNMTQLQRLGKTIPLWITEWPDVTDIDNNGTNEVVDVAYYSIPSSGSGIVSASNWRPEVYNKTYWTKAFGRYAGLLPSKNTFKLTKTATGNGGVFTGLPKYGVVGGVLQPVGYYTEATPIMTAPQRPTQIIQFREDGVNYSGADRSGEDVWGSYPPGIVNKF